MIVHSFIPFLALTLLKLTKSTGFSAAGVKECKNISVSHLWKAADEPMRSPASWMDGNHAGIGGLENEGEEGGEIKARMYDVCLEKLLQNGHRKWRLAFIQLAKHQHRGGI